MPKNLLFLSDKLPKPNYDKQLKNNNTNGIDENKNYRSFNKVNNNKINNNKDEIEIKDFNKGIHIKKPTKLAPLPNIPEEKITRNNISIENNKQNTIKNNSHSTNDITNINGEDKNNNISNISNILVSKSNNNINNNKIILKKDEMYNADILSKQKNDLRKIMLKNSSINRRIGYVQLNSSPIKDLNRMFLANLNNKSAPKKLNNNNLILKNKYYIQSPPYLKGIEKYHENIRKLDYDYRNNYNNNIKIYKEGPENKVVPKIPRRLSPIKKNIPNFI